MPPTRRSDILLPPIELDRVSFSPSAAVAVAVEESQRNNVFTFGLEQGWANIFYGGQHLTLYCYRGRIFSI